MSDTETLAVRIERIRTERGITRPQLAKILEVSNVTIWSWERDRRRPSAANLSALAEALGVSFGILTGTPDDDVKTPSPKSKEFRETLSKAKSLINDELGIPLENIVIKIRY